MEMPMVASLATISRRGKDANFEGREEKLKGRVYDSARFKQADMYTCSTCEIVDPVGRKYTSGLDVRQAIMKGVTPIFSTPFHQQQVQILGQSANGKKD